MDQQCIQREDAARPHHGGVRDHVELQHQVGGGVLIGKESQSKNFLGKKFTTPYDLYQYE